MWIKDRDGELINLDYVRKIYYEKQEQMEGGERLFLNFTFNDGKERNFKLNITTGEKFCNYISDIIEHGKEVKVITLSDELEQIIEGTFKTFDEFNNK